MYVIKLHQQAQWTSVDYCAEDPKRPLPAGPQGWDFRGVSFILAAMPTTNLTGTLSSPLVV